MTAAGTGDELNTLRIRAEQALQRDLPKDHVRGLLEALATRAVEGSPEACFANRHLAEMLLEESPWRAALHLRRLLRSCPEDDAGHALMGLSQALQANYRMAVSSFRRAVAISPANPWYHHNLGHLLDVALSRPQDAVAHLQRAFRTQPSQEEVGASYASASAAWAAAPRGSRSWARCCNATPATPSCSRSSHGSNAAPHRAPGVRRRSRSRRRIVPARRPARSPAGSSAAPSRSWAAPPRTSTRRWRRGPRMCPRRPAR
ncbi:MAG: hypothetical protein IPN17_05020 [Deltaproteobacteria bacterium]|nr:hypothetical protein [Deltaproteobacteria bacterium]